VVSEQCRAAEQSTGVAPNVLFIAIDDLRDWIGCMGVYSRVKTPHIDRLAARGMLFDRSYCAAPVCNPSRTALLSGLLPSTSGVYNNGTDWRRAIVDLPMLPLHFRQNGYFVAGAGKIYHGTFHRDSDWDDYQENEGTHPQPESPQTSGAGAIKFAPIDCDDSELPDYQIVSYALEQLSAMRDKPIFLACGLHKPHMPWYVPRKYYDMYPLDMIQLPAVIETDLDDVPAAGVKMASPEGDHANILRSGRWKEAVQGYLAAISFTDAMIGRLLDGLDRSPDRDRTIVVLWSDHGWHLGEKMHWRKFALWEESTRAPMIWVVPGITKPGSVCHRTVDLMSVYPTLCELAGIPTPKHLEGVSIRSLLVDAETPWVRPARTTHQFDNHAVRTERWRYIRYRDGSEELYDEANDPHEWTNLSNRPEYHALKMELAEWLPKVNNMPPKESTRRRRDER
jgi:arylsulfatase A-like enzyme